MISRRRQAVDWLAPALPRLRIDVRPRGLHSLRQRVPGCGWRIISASPDSAVGVGFRDCETRDGGRGSPAALTWMQQSVAAAVLPKGFPHSVRPNYLPYVQFTALGLLAGRVQSVLATQAMLFTVGLGAGAIPMAAAIQWVLKDGIGHAGAVAYATSVNTRFDADAKRYRFQATVALTIADFIAVGMPLCPQYFLPLASVSSAISSIASLAQTSSRARVMASFALRGNLADCTRAGQTQAKVMSIVGTSAGAGLSWCIGPDQYSVALCMMPLACISLVSMHISTRLVVLRGFNVQRAERVFRDVLLRGHRCGDSPSTSLGAKVKTPEHVADEEVFARPYSSIFACDLLVQPLIGGPPTGTWRAAIPFSSHVPMSAIDELLVAQSTPCGSDLWRLAWHEQGKYVVAIENWGRPARQRAAVWYYSEAEVADKLMAVWHACVLRHAAMHSEWRQDAGLSEVSLFAVSTWPQVLQGVAEAGWHTHAAYLDGEAAFLYMDHTDGASTASACDARHTSSPPLHTLPTQGGLASQSNKETQAARGLQ